MTTLYMLELRIDLPLLLRFLQGQGLDIRDGDEDLGYGIPGWLAATFGPLAPKPWRLFVGRGRPPRILGYGRADAEQLRRRLRELAEPASAAVCPDPETMIAGKAMPSWRHGRRLGFEVLCCPVGRKAEGGIEKDLFLIRADSAPPGALTRDRVYSDWVRERLERQGACTVTSIRLEGFRLVRQTRRVQGSRHGRGQRHITRPQALLRGELMVGDPEAFASLLCKGIGRHRAFGYGMVLLRPPS
ncbi:MAG: type I-E CRISPR-associated protein Cas6/Cse3/CasE [Firmicutes bacterium]|nr:type I-E CRISPR-associated protein Cas6/Cse3/CasE [Bacillota bacterium]